MANASINFKISIKNGIFIVLHNFFVVVAYNIKFSSRHRRPLSLIYVFFFLFSFEIIHHGLIINI